MQTKYVVLAMYGEVECFTFYKVVNWLANKGEVMVKLVNDMLYAYYKKVCMRSNVVAIFAE